MSANRKVWLWVAAIASFVAVGVHFYLAQRHIALQFGGAEGGSICNLNATFNCDAVQTSTFSKFLGIPVAAWGFATNLVLLFLIATQFFGLSYLAFWLATFVLGGSVVMGVLSLSLGAYCLFCIIAYVLSLITWEALRRWYGGAPWGSLGETMRSLTESFGRVVPLLLIPAIAWLVDGMLSDKYGGKEELRIQTSEWIEDWKNSPSYNFQTAGALHKGASSESAKIKIVEFADFRCHHCKSAAPSLHAFVQSRPDVSLSFMFFPLDGECNSAIQRGDGLSCLLAKTVYCANQTGKGWAMHDSVFAAQDEFLRMGSVDVMKTKLKSLAESIQADWVAIDACTQSEQTQTAIKQFAEQGVNAKVSGTPAIFVNGKPLSGAQVLSVMQKATESL